MSLKHVNIDVITDADAVSCLVQTFCDHHLSGLQPVTNRVSNFAVNGVVSCLLIEALSASLHRRSFSSSHV